MSCEYILVVECANCGADIKNKCFWLSDSPVEVSISSFECDSFYCEECGKTSYSGDIYLYSEDEV